MGGVGNVPGAVTHPLRADVDARDSRSRGVGHGGNGGGLRTIFISKDINARVKCDALGIPSEDFEADRLDADWLYAGYATMRCPGETIDELYQERQLSLEPLEGLHLKGPTVMDRQAHQPVANPCFF